MRPVSGLAKLASSTRFERVKYKFGMTSTRCDNHVYVIGSHT